MSAKQPRASDTAADRSGHAITGIVADLYYIIRWGDPHDRKLYRKSVRNISRYETSLHRKKIGGIQKRERSIGVTLYVGSFAAI